MAGRIRTIKPEIIDDEKAAGLSDSAWRLWVSSWVLADDYGRLRAPSAYLKGTIWWHDNHADKDIVAIMQELKDEKMVTFYEIDGQQYAAVRGWGKHQKVSRPGKPRVPPPPATVRKVPASDMKIPASDTTSRPDDENSNGDGALPEIPASDRKVPATVRTDHDHDLDQRPPTTTTTTTTGDGDGCLQDASDALSHLNAKADRKLSFQSAETMKPILARLRGEEGEPMATLEQLKLIIDHRCDLWLGTEREQWLRPQTLFIPKYYAGYLEAATKWDDGGRKERRSVKTGSVEAMDISEYPEAGTVEKDW